MTKSVQQVKSITAHINYASLEMPKTTVLVFEMVGGHSLWGLDQKESNLTLFQKTTK